MSLVALMGCPEEPATVFLPGAPDAAAADAGAKDAGRDAGSSKPSMDSGTDQGTTGSRKDAAVAPARTFALTSDVVKNGEALPVDYRCQEDGPGVSPPLSWTEGPEGTGSYAVVVRDVTSPTRSQIHWLVYDIPAGTRELPEGVGVGAEVEGVDGAKQARNYLSEPGYRGPCAPSGTNKYEFAVYAVPSETLEGVRANTASSAVVKSIEEGALKSAKLSVESSPEN